MKKVVLNELIISNFKGVNAHHKFGANENIVSGKNASGKTTIIRAWNWLLTGYSDCNSPMNADLFNNKEEITKDTPIASVKAVVSIDNEIYTIERSAEAKFQRKRGTESWEKASSDSYVYKVDEIERSANDFRDWLSEKFTDVDMLKFAVDGSYFVASIFEDKKKSRQIIERLVGSVTREEMSGDYSVIDDLLKRYDLNEIDQRAANMAKAINDRLNEIPALIRNKETEIADIEQTDFVATDREIAELEAERDRLDKQMTDLAERIKPQMDAKHEAERNRQMLQDVFDKAYSEWEKSFTSRMENISEEVNAIRRQNDKSAQLCRDEEERRKALADIIQNEERLLDTTKQKCERLRKERDEQKAVTMDESSTLCPHCGAQLQGEKLQEVTDRFEKVKRERIAAIVAEGKKTAADLKAITKRIEGMKAQLEAPLPEVVSQSTDELEKKYAELAKTDKSRNAFMETEHGKSLLNDINSVVIPDVVMPDNSEIIEAKKTVNDGLIPLYERRGLKNRLTTLKEQLDVLHTEQREKGSELALYERQRNAVKDFKQEQMEILSRKVNDGLKFSRLEVWSKQKDGNIIPDIVIKNKDGVSFATANNASRLVTTIDIQRFFCERLGVNMPIFLDEASTIDTENIPHYDNTQMFLLFRADTSLKIDSK